MQLFSTVTMYNGFEKKFNIFLAPENMKKTP